MVLFTSLKNHINTDIKIKLESEMRGDISLEKFVLYMDEIEQHIKWLFKIDFISFEEYNELISSITWAYDIIGDK